MPLGNSLRRPERSRDQVFLNFGSEQPPRLVDLRLGVVASNGVRLFWFDYLSREEGSLLVVHESQLQQTVETLLSELQNWRSAAGFSSIVGGPGLTALPVNDLPLIVLFEHLKISNFVSTSIYRNHWNHREGPEERAEYIADYLISILVER
jgi:hypothetical protein